MIIKLPFISKYLVFELPLSLLSDLIISNLYVMCKKKKDIFAVFSNLTCKIVLLVA